MANGDYLEKIRNILSACEVTITSHAALRLSQRAFINPQQLLEVMSQNVNRFYYAEPQPSSPSYPDSEKFKCYYKQSKRLHYGVVFAFNPKTNSLILVTIIKLNTYEVKKIEGMLNSKKIQTAIKRGMG